MFPTGFSRNEAASGRRSVGPGCFDEKRRALVLPRYENAALKNKQTNKPRDAYAAPFKREVVAVLVVFVVVVVAVVVILLLLLLLLFLSLLLGWWLFMSLFCLSV